MYYAYYGYGTVFKISTNGTFTTLYAFGTVTNASGDSLDGGNPQAGLVQGSDGYFYGTTQGGGGVTRWGTVFKISPNGALTTLYAFGMVTNADGQPLDGGNPAAGLVLGSDGYFYGTTDDGGTNDDGTVFKISTNGVLTSLYSFSITYGAAPSGLVQGSDGNFYGTTYYGGTSGIGHTSGYGTVFKISPNGALTTLYAFGTVTNADGQPLDGASPAAGLVLGSDGYFYGTTDDGGTNDDGTVFKISTNGALTTLYAFGTVRNANGDPLDGAYPFAALVQGSDGNFYGTTGGGGTYDDGTVFRLTIGPQPQLTLIPSGPYMILTWPTNYSGFTLQSTTNFGSSAVWTTNSPPPVVIGGDNVVINTASGNQQFYRLSQ